MATAFAWWGFDLWPIQRVRTKSNTINPPTSRPSRTQRNGNRLTRDGSIDAKRSDVGFGGARDDVDAVSQDDAGNLLLYVRLTRMPVEWQEPGPLLAPLIAAWWSDTEEVFFQK